MLFLHTDLQIFRHRSHSRSLSYKTPLSIYSDRTKKNKRFQKIYTDKNTPKKNYNIVFWVNECVRPPSEMCRELWRANSNENDKQENHLTIWIQFVE